MNVRSLRLFRTYPVALSLLLLTFVLFISPVELKAQPTFKQLPGYDRYVEFSGMRQELSGGGRVEKLKWSDDGKKLSFTLQGKRMSLDLVTFQIAEGGEEGEAENRPQGRGRGAGGPGRARQRESEASPDGKWKAVYRDFNVYLESGEKGTEAPFSITSDGNEKLRYGTGCWVYGEELDQAEAMWWSPDSTKLAFYEIDERSMKDYYLTLDNTASYTSIKAVRYPKSGDDNPKVSLWIYDIATKAKRKIEIEGEPTQYLYGIRFSPSGKELLVHRTNRRQDQLDILAIDVESLKVRTVVSERQSTWQNNSPIMQFLKDQERFVWETEGNQFRHFQLRHLDGRLLNPLSQVAEYACGAITKIDEEAGWFYYTAFSDKNPYNVQLHRSKLDGSDSRRLTSSPLNHGSFDIAPNHQFVVAVREQYDTPPSTVVYDATGKEVAILAQGSRAAAEEKKLSPPELFSFLADDGKTIIYGTLNKPSNFDENKKYPLLIDVYGGPASVGINNRYTPVNPICELGFIVAKIGNRGTVGRGKAFESATYLKLGGPDLADQADGVKYLAQRPYVDGSRVGIFGHSYGGYMSALAVLKRPDVFHVAVAGAPVTDFRNYDTIYTERYMRTPAENKEGYDQGSCMPLAKNLKGKLLLVHGLIDDNVHPSNTWQLAKSLNDADQRFDMMIYPEFEHGVGSTYSALRWEYFCKHLKP